MWASQVFASEADGTNAQSEDVKLRMPSEQMTQSFAPGPSQQRHGNLTRWRDIWPGFQGWTCPTVSRFTNAR